MFSELLFSLFGTIIICTIILWLFMSPFYWRSRGVPYLIPLPIFGNFFQLFRMDPVEFYKKLNQNYPNEKFYGLHHFTRPALFLRDPEMIKELTNKQFEHFSGSTWYVNQDNDPFGVGLLCQSGQAWKDVRKRLTPYFTKSKLRPAVNNIETTINKLCEIINDSIKDNKKDFEILKLMKAVTTQIIFQTLFNVQVDSFNRMSPFAKPEYFTLTARTKYSIIIGSISSRLSDLLKRTYLDKHSIQFVEKFLRDTIQFRNTNNIVHEDFLQGMMELIENEDGQGKEKRYFADNTRVPEYNYWTVTGHSLTLIAAGVDTTAITLALLLYEMAMNQEVQDKCRKNIMDVINDTGIDIRPEDMIKLTYLDMAMKETLRKYPIVKMTARKCIKPYILPNLNLTIEPGTSILIPTRILHHDPHIFNEPEKFIPERFLPENIGKIKQPGNYHPFGFGPRTCLGNHLAKLEIFLVISRLLHNYRFTLSDPTKTTMKVHHVGEVLTQPVNGVWLNVEPLNVL